LSGLAKGLQAPMSYFGGFDPGDARMGSHRFLGERHVSILDDHDHVFGEKIRFSSEAASDHQVVAGLSLQLFTLGIPCIYYGTEQAMSGPEPEARHWLPGWKGSDRYLREAMFGPEHPRKQGRHGLAASPEALDLELPGFGAFGTSGRHCFDADHPAYVRASALGALRHAHPVLRHGRQYLRSISFLGRPFAVYGPGEIVAWSRILDDEEVLCVLNPHGLEPRGARIIVDAALNPPGTRMTVVLNSAEAAVPQHYTGTHPVGSGVPVEMDAQGAAFVELRDVGPSEVVVLTNHPVAGDGSVL